MQKQHFGIRIVNVCLGTCKAYACASPLHDLCIVFVCLFTCIISGDPRAPLSEFGRKKRMCTELKQFNFLSPFLWSKQRFPAPRSERIAFSKPRGPPLSCDSAVASSRMPPERQRHCWRDLPERTQSVFNTPGPPVKLRQRCRIFPDASRKAAKALVQLAGANAERFHDPRATR